MKCYAKSSVNLIARLANLHPKTTFFIKVFSFVFLVPEKRIIFAKVQRRIKSKIRLSYRLSFKLLVVNQSNMLHRKITYHKQRNNIYHKTVIIRSIIAVFLFLYFIVVYFYYPFIYRIFVPLMYHKEKSGLFVPH